MGYQVESYSLKELHRIAVPGKTAPSLFWVLPIGRWRPGELDDVWQWFNARQGKACQKFGLLLAKDMGRPECGEASVSLAAVAGKLSDLMPAGMDGFLTHSALREDGPRVLVLAGGYPQPGWGVLVDWQSGDVRGFEDRIRRTIAALSGVESGTQSSHRNSG